MGADQIAAIRPAIVELEEAPAAEDWCATFEVPGTGLWVQVVLGTLNFSYPYADNPGARLRDLGFAAPGLEPTGWQPGKYATFSHAPLPSQDLAKLVDRLFVELLGCDHQSYEIDVSLERL